MDVANINLNWVVIGLASVFFCFLFFRRGNKKTAIKRPDNLEIQLSQLRQQLHSLKARYNTQVDFFVNFPEVIKHLTAALTTEQVTSACSRAISTLLNTHFIAIFLAESKTDLLLMDGAGFKNDLRRKLTLPVGQSGLVEILTYRGVSNLNDHPIAQEHMRHHNLPDQVAMPIWYGSVQLGLIVIAQSPGEMEVTQRILAMLADLTGVALHAAKQVSRIQSEADTDALTGLANRRALKERVTLEIQRSLSYQTAMSLAMIDVDHFKNYNDQNGHSAGDQVLKSVARLAAGTTRKTDMVARYGGEEFTVVMGGANKQMAHQHAERIRRTIAQQPFPHAENQPLGCLSISVGIATMPDDATTLEGLFEKADQALYEAKRMGRNQVVAYQAPRPKGTS